MGRQVARKDGDVGANATSSHLTEMNSAFTFQSLRRRNWGEVYFLGIALGI
jgi:hypothetical protein